MILFKKSGIFIADLSKLCFITHPLHSRNRHQNQTVYKKLVILGAKTTRTQLECHFLKKNLDKNPWTVERTTVKQRAHGHLFFSKMGDISSLRHTYFGGVALRILSRVKRRRIFKPPTKKWKIGGAPEV